jgi:hypothetical protein
MLVTFAHLEWLKLRPSVNLHVDYSAHTVCPTISRQHLGVQMSYLSVCYGWFLFGSLSLSACGCVSSLPRQSSVDNMSLLIGMHVNFVRIRMCVREERLASTVGTEWMNIIVVSDLCLNCSRTASLLGPPFNNKLWPVHISVDNVLSDEKLYSLRF